MSVSEGMRSTANSGDAGVMLYHEGQGQSIMMQQSADAHAQVP